MKKNDLIILGAAGVAVLLILKAGGISPTAKLRQWRSGLSYDPGAGYGDTSRYDAYASTARASGGWGIE